MTIRSLASAWLVVFAFVAPVGGAAFGQEIPPHQEQHISAKARKSIVQIVAHWVQPGQPDNICAEDVKATAFLISASGYALTARHVILPPMKTLASGAKEALCPGFTQLRIDGRIGYAQTGQVVVGQLVGSEEWSDSALIKFAEKRDGYEVADYCNAPDPVSPSPLLATGFPRGEEFEALHASFQNSSGPAGRWTMESSTTYGMSGGPAYNAKGRVVAFVQGGVDDTNAIKYFVPLHLARGTIERSEARLLDCSESISGPIRFTAPRVVDIRTRAPTSKPYADRVAAPAVVSFPLDIENVNDVEIQLRKSVVVVTIGSASYSLDWQYFVTQNDEQRKDDWLGVDGTATSTTITDHFFYKTILHASKRMISWGALIDEIRSQRHKEVLIDNVITYQNYTNHVTCTADISPQSDVYKYLVDQMDNKHILPGWLNFDCSS